MLKQPGMYTIDHSDNNSWQSLLILYHGKQKYTILTSGQMKFTNVILYSFKPLFFFPVTVSLA